MRLPIFPADLSAKHGFYRIAKKLKRSWPSSTRLSFSAAQEIIARSLGYRDLHDVQQSADNDASNATPLTRENLRDNITTAIVVFCRTKNIIDIDESGVNRLVMLLPLHDLYVFKTPLTEQPPSYIPASESKLDEVASQRIAYAVDKSDQERNGISGMTGSTKSASQIVSVATLEQISQAVRSKGILRDQCLCAGLLEGVRALQLVTTKVQDISFHTSIDNEHVILQLPTVKSRPPVDRPMPSGFGRLVNDYVKQAALRPGDYIELGSTLQSIIAEAF